MYQFIVLPYFERQLKRLVRKHRHLKDDVILALEKFAQLPKIHLSNNVYKLRIKSRDLPRGKSKSYRLIVLVIETDKFLVPVTVYFKGAQADISEKELNDYLEVIFSELYD